MVKQKYEIKQDYKIPAGVAGKYRKGKPEGVVLHSSANPNANLWSEIRYMAAHYKNAFTHAWCDKDNIIEISNTDYACWGAGGVANPRFAQIEITEDKTRSTKEHQQAIDRQAFWCAMQLAYYGIVPKDATKDGNGTVWTHAAVSKYLGGTNHTDPLAYYSRYGVSWQQVYDQIVRYYNSIMAGKGGLDVRGLEQGEAKRYDTESGKYPSDKFSVGDKVTFTKIAAYWIKVKHSDGSVSRGDPISQHDRSVAWQVVSLEQDGSVAVHCGTKAVFYAYDRDLQKVEPMDKKDDKLADNEVRLDGKVYRIVKK